MQQRVKHQIERLHARQAQYLDGIRGLVFESAMLESAPGLHDAAIAEQRAHATALVRLAVDMGAPRSMCTDTTRTMPTATQRSLSRVLHERSRGANEVGMRPEVPREPSEQGTERQMLGTLDPRRGGWVRPADFVRRAGGPLP
jgi:hypothetical protein